MTTTDSDRCCWPRCRRPASLTYSAAGPYRPLCAPHWALYCTMQDAGREDEARRLMNCPTRNTPTRSPDHVDANA